MSPRASGTGAHLRAATTALLLGIAACTAQRGSASEVQVTAVAKAVVPPPAPKPPAASVAACRVRRAGPAPLRRLTREQYTNSITDLLGGTTEGVRELRELRGVSVVAALTLPSDERVGPFRSNLVAAPTALDAQQLMEVSEAAANVAAKRADDLLRCPPGGDDAACARAFVDDFAPRAFRRPLRDDERERYVRLFLEEARGGDRPGGVRAVVRTLLQSPYFVHHTQEDGAAADGLVPLGPYALASRLSYTLWMSAPDRALLDAAASGALATPEGLRAQAQRLLADERSARAVGSFHLQWLGVEDVASMPKSGKQFELWNRKREGGGRAPLGRALRRETERFVDHVIRGPGGGKLDTLLTAPFSFLEGPLFELYGVEEPAGHDPARPVALNARERSGVLTHGSVMAFHAHAAQSSPILRGLLVRRNFLCQELPDPPPNVNNTPPDPDPKLTTRERFEEHRLDVGCGGCHKLIDPLGFGFESYDAIGRYRAEENGHAVDASGELVEAGEIDGSFTGAVELSRRLAASPRVRACYVRQWLRFALGRRESEADACSLRTLEEKFEESGRDVRALLLALPTTDSFRFRAPDGPVATR